MITLNGHSLTIVQMKKILFDKERVQIDDSSLEKVKTSREAVERIVEHGDVVYGINTGFGKLSDVPVPKEDVEALQRNLIHSHACGVGEPFPEPVGRAMLILRLNALLKGVSGVRPVIVHTLRDMINANLSPVVPQQGSLGASGDLAPLAHLALALMGEGDVFVKGELRPALKVLDEYNIKPVTLRAKEGLALINGTQAMTAMGVIGYLEAENLAQYADLVSALTIEGLQGIIDAFDEDVHIARGYEEQVDVAARIRDYLEGSRLTTRQGQLRVQDATPSVVFRKCTEHLGKR